MSDGDDLPEDLDVTAYVGPYVFPDIRRRRIAGTLYAVLGLGVLWAALASSNRGLLFGAILLLAIAAYHFAAGWPLKIDQTEALAVASRAVGFPSATHPRSWGGEACCRVRRGASCSTAPRTRPRTRGLVELDAVDGHVIGEYTERNPEDWSQL